MIGPKAISEINPASIFISYRRADSRSETGRIYDHLVVAFGSDHVFKDVSSIPLGVDFSEHLEQALSQCQVVLVIIGNTWVNITEPNGKRRLENPNDFVRIEVETALRRNIPIIPILLEGVTMPLNTTLPDSLQPLIRFQASLVGDDPRFQGDMGRLVEGIKSLLKQPISIPKASKPRSFFSLTRRNFNTLLLFGLAELGTVSWLTSRRQNLSTLTDINPRKEAYDSKTKRVTFNVVYANTSGDIEATRVTKNTYRIEKWGWKNEIEFRQIPEGSFRIGTSLETLESLESFQENEASPDYSININSFWMAKDPITERQWKSIARTEKINHRLPDNTGISRGDNYPVDNVSWNEAVEFCQRLSRETGRNYRLPSESEWEYACRAGTTTFFHFGETLTPTLAHYYPIDNSSEVNTESIRAPKGPVPVNHFNWANAFGLYNMHGNVWEWCQDRYHREYQDGLPTDGTPWVEAGDETGRVFRGGSFKRDAIYCRAATRGTQTEETSFAGSGFRIACNLRELL